MLILNSLFDCASVKAQNNSMLIVCPAQRINSYIYIQNTNLNT